MNEPMSGRLRALRLKLSDFKSLEGEKINGSFTRLKGLLNDLENNGVTIPKAEVNATFDSDSDVEEDQRTNNEFMVDLNVKYHERALLANQKRFYKRSDRLSEKGKKDKEKSKKGLLTESLDWDDESVSSDNKGSTMISASMAIAEDEPSVGKTDARSSQWVNITIKKVHTLLSMTDGDERKHVLDYTHVDLHYVEDQRKNLQVSRNIVKALGGKGRKKEKISSKEIIFTKANDPLSTLAPKITSDSESQCDSQEPLPKLIGAAPSGTSEILISLSDLTLNTANLTLDTLKPKKTRPSAKVSPAYVIKKKTEKSSFGSKP
ncbi:hypothetical protein Tco_0428829 [Tanacetum coccineum]